MSKQIEDVLAQLEEKFQSKFQKKQLSNPEIAQELQNDVQTTMFKSNYNHQLHPSQTEKENIQKILKPIIVINDQNNEVDKNCHQNQNFGRDYESKLLKNNQKENQEIKDDEQSEEEQCYLSLSNKLEIALQKIDEIKNKNHYVNKSGLLTRFQLYQLKRKKQLEEKKRQLNQKKYHGIQTKPQINTKSKTMIINHQPIHTRFEKIVQQKKLKQEIVEAEKKDKQQEVFKRFLTEYQEHVKSPTNTRTADDFYTEMIEWKVKKEKETEVISDKLKKKQLEGVTFKPVLNSNSKKMLQNKVRVPIYQRQIKPKNVQEEIYSFKPKINKRKTVS